MTRPPIRLALLGFVNAYLVPERDGLTLIDTGLAPLVPRIVRTAHQLGRPIKRIMLTHGHSDHAGGVDAVQKAFPEAEFLMHRADEPLLAENGVKAKPSGYLVAGDQVGSLHVHAAPGHSPGQLAFLDEREGTLYTGDSFVTFGRLHSVTEFYAPFLLPTLATWDQEQALATVQNLARLPSVNWIAPGHGPPVRDSGGQLAEAAARAVQIGLPTPAQVKPWQPLMKMMRGRNSASS